MNHQYVKNVVEAALLAAGRPLTLEELTGVFDERDGSVADEVKTALAALTEDYATRGLELLEVASGFRNPSAPPIAKARASFKAGNREGTGRVPFLKQDGADRLDVSGEPFPGHVSLTRDVPERRP